MTYACVRLFYHFKYSFVLLPKCARKITDFPLQGSLLLFESDSIDESNSFNNVCTYDGMSINDHMFPVCYVSLSESESLT